MCTCRNVVSVFLDESHYHETEYVTSSALIYQVTNCSNFEVMSSKATELDQQCTQGRAP